MIYITKTIEEKDTFTFEFRIDKDMVEGFVLALQGLKAVAETIRVKIRKEENKKRAFLEAHEKERKEFFNKMKTEIRTLYEKNLKDHTSTRAFKETRKKFKEYYWVVTEVQKEYREKRDLEIMRLTNNGYNSFEIARHLKIHQGAVRKIICILKEKNFL